MFAGQSEEQALLKHINIYVCTVTESGYFGYLNSYWMEKLGWSYAELKANPWSHFVHPEDVELSVNTAQSIFEKGVEVTHFTNRYRTKDDQWRYLEWTARQSEDKRYVIATATDTTEKNLYQIEKQKSDQLLRAAGSVANLGYWSLDFETGSLLWSDEIYRIHGVSRDDFLPDVKSAIRFYHPEDRDRIRACVEDGLKSGGGWSFQGRIIRPDGEVRSVLSKAEVVASPVGKPAEVFGIYQDITELESVTRERDLLSKVVEHSITGIVIADSNKEVIWVNQAFTAITGYSLPELEGKPLGGLLHGPETCQDTVAEIRDKLNSQQVVNVEVLNYHKNGAAYWIHLVITPVISDGHVDYFVGVQQDVTQMKQQQAVLARMQKMETVKELAAGVAHDFNNTLAIIDGNRELMELKCRDDALAPYLANMHKAINRAKSTTERLLKSSHQATSASMVFSVAETLSELQDLFNEITPKNKGLNWSLQADCCVKLSPADLSDAVTNIIVNAINSIEHHGEVLISSRIVTHGFSASSDTFVYARPLSTERYCCIRVQDNGVGIAKEELESLFLPFVSKKRFSAGSGLGLSMVAAFVARAGVGLTVDTAEGHGSTFSLWLPVYSDIADTPRHKTEVVTDKQRRLRLVLIDDEADLLLATQHLLMAAGNSVAAFSNASEAVEWIEGHRDAVDIIVSDETMPGENQGHDIFARYNESIGVVIISGYGKDLYERFPYSQVVKKPFSSNQLLAAIRKVYDERHRSG